ncbi:MAG: alpha-L-fucosidase [Acidobacteriia bacterium]|nr:alpha-L-fucosidase [Terriglobia bacterium]
MQNRPTKTILLAICAAALLLAAGWSQQRPANPQTEPAIPRMLPGQTPPAARPDPDRERRINWWREARFGMFIHWGLYAIPAGEWKGQPIGGIGEWIMNRARIPVTEYEQLARQYNPVKFNAEQWVQIAKGAGMKYIVITSKHHDGFAMYGSKVSKYNIVDATPFGRDPMKELAAACQKAGIRLCFYYSHAQDWHEPDGAGNNWDFPPNPEKNFAKYFEAKAIPQVRELLTNYGPVGLMWFDTPQLITRDQAYQLRDVVHSLQANTLVSGRIGYDAGDYDSAGDNQISVGVTSREWETPVTMNDTWGFKKDDQNWKAPSVLIRQLVRIASKGGNYLLNVGPTSEGEIPPPSVERLAEVGKWLKVNGESVQATGPNPFPYNLEWGYVTTGPNRIYLHVVEWPGKDVAVYGIKNKIQRAWLLADAGRKRLAVKQESKPALDYYSATIQVPAAAPDKYDSVIALETSGVPEVIKTLSQQPGGGVSLDGYLGQLHKASSASTLSINTSGMLGGWVDAKDWVSWDFKTFQPATYEVAVLTSARGFGRRGGPPPAGAPGTAGRRGPTAGAPTAAPGGMPGRGLAPPAWQGGQKLLVEVAGRQIRGTLADNGRSSDPSDPRASYVISNIGRVTIDRPGAQRLVLRAEDEELQKTLGLSLHSLRLVPVK